jgi:hypothetical protein
MGCATISPDRHRTSGPMITMRLSRLTADSRRPHSAADLSPVIGSRCLLAPYCQCVVLSSLDYVAPPEDRHLGQSTYVLRLSSRSFPVLHQPLMTRSARSPWRPSAVALRHCACLDRRQRVLELTYTAWDTGDSFARDLAGRRPARSSRDDEARDRAASRARRRLLPPLQVIKSGRRRLHHWIAFPHVNTRDRGAGPSERSLVDLQREWRRHRYRSTVPLGSCSRPARATAITARQIREYTVTARSRSKVSRQSKTHWRAPQRPRQVRLTTNACYSPVSVSASDVDDIDQARRPTRSLRGGTTVF